MRKLYIIILLFAFLPLTVTAQGMIKPGHTVITKWQDGKTAAVSLTYDDNTINQFRVALPLMQKYGFKGTFYVITGSVPGSEFKPKYVGRPLKEIIAETAKIPTNKNNFYERASAIRFAPYNDAYKYHARAGELIEAHKPEQAYKVIDEGFAKIRSGALKPSTVSAEVKKYLDAMLFVKPNVDLITWPKLEQYAKEGFEIGSHSVSHSYLCVLDSANMAYELTKSKDELMNHLGPSAAFSAECPFGIEDPRVMRMGHEIYAALRNRMPRPYLTEIDRGSKANPLKSNREYVQWQRGPLTHTPMTLMKSWVDTTLERKNIWLVLVIHGVDGIGWEPLTHQELDEYFSYIKDRQNHLWVGTFEDVTKYIRERVAGKVNDTRHGSVIDVKLVHNLNPVIYNLPLTLKTYVPTGWKSVRVRQGRNTKNVQTGHDGSGTYVMYRAAPNGPDIVLTGM